VSSKIYHTRRPKNILRLQILFEKSDRNIDSKTKAEYEQLVPPLCTIEYACLKQTIKANNCNIVQISINRAGIIINGHHIFKACQELGIDLKIETKGIADELEAKEFIISINGIRIKLNPYQNVELATKLNEIEHENVKKRLSEADKFGSDVSWKAEKKIMVDDIKSIHTKLLIIAQTVANIEEENKTTQRAIALLKQTLIEFLSFKKDNLVRKREQRF
jgi:hypothetical protein